MVGVWVVRAGGVANKVKDVFLVQGRERVRLDGILIVLHGVEVRDEDVVMVSGVSGKTQDGVGVGVSYEIVQANVEQSGIGIDLFKEGLDDVPVIGVPLFDDSFGVRVGAEEVFPFEDGVVIDVVLVDDGFFGRDVICSYF